MVPSGQLNIWIVDDDADDRALIRAAFEKVDFPLHVEMAEDGVDLLEKLKESGPSSELPVFVLDIRMPRMNGLQTLAELRQSEFWRFAPIIMLTTSDAPQDIADAYALGASALFVKPNTMADLERLIDVVASYWKLVRTMPAPDLRPSA